MKLEFNHNNIWYWLMTAIWAIGIREGHAQSTNLTTADLSGENIIWAAETNEIQVGLIVNPLCSTNNSPVRCVPVITTTGNQENHLWLWFPPAGNCCQMTLTDEDGHPVPKTAKAKSLGKPITEPLMLKDGPNFKAGYKMRPLAQNRPEVLSDFSFVVQDYFKVTNSGKYRLEYKLRVIWTQGRKGNYMVLHTTNLPVLNLPPVVAEIEVKNRERGSQ